MKCPECSHPMYMVNEAPNGKKLYECQSGACPHYKQTGWRFQVSA